MNIGSVLKGLIGSLKFSDSPDDWSGRKLTAIAITSCIVAAHIVWLTWAYKKGDFSLLPVILPSDIALITACLGLTTYERVKTTPTGNNTITDKVG